MNRSSHISAHALLLLGTAFAIFPFLWMGWAAINDSSVAFSGGGAAARQFAVTENFSRAFTEAPMARYLLNGVIVCAGILICQIVTALPCAYALAKLPVKGRNLILGGIVLCFAIPFQSVALPIFVGLAQFKLLNTYSALILPFATQPWQ
jgi:multiple sugar transport system permease protein